MKVAYVFGVSFILEKIYFNDIIISFLPKLKRFFLVYVKIGFEKGSSNKKQKNTFDIIWKNGRNDVNSLTDFSFAQCLNNEKSFN